MILYIDNIINIKKIFLKLNLYIYIYLLYIVSKFKIIIYFYSDIDFIYMSIIIWKLINNYYYMETKF